MNGAWSVANNIAQGQQGPEGPPGETFPAGQAEHQALVATSATAERWSLLGSDNFDSGTQRRLLPASASNGEIMIWDPFIYGGAGGWEANAFPTVNVNAPITGDGADNPLNIDEATTSAKGAMSATDKTKLDGITLSDNVPGRSTRNAGSSGTSTEYARSDHSHQSANTGIRVVTLPMTATLFLLLR